MFKIVLMVSAVWCAWRLFVMSWNYFRPVRAAVNTATTNGLNSLGLEQLAMNSSDLNMKMETMVDNNININSKRVFILLATLAATFVLLYWSFTLA